MPPPPPLMDAAAVDADRGVSASASAFAGAVVAPPDLAQPVPDGDRLAGRGAEEGREADPASRRDADPALPGVPSAVGPADTGLRLPSALAALRAKPAPFSARPGAGRRAVPTASGPESAGTVLTAPAPNPTRTAMRVRPVTPPFSGRRQATDEANPSPFLPPLAPPMMARSEAPEAVPFYGKRSAREVLRNETAGLSVAEPTFARPSAPPSVQAPTVMAAPTSPLLPWDAEEAPPRPVVAPYGGEGRALDHPMFQPGTDAFATVVVSNGGVDVIADGPGRAGMRFAALPADPGAWPDERSGAVATIDTAADPVDPGVPSGDRIATLLFDNGSVEVGEQERQILREVARIQKLDNRPVTLVGHASGRTWADNVLAQRRTNMRISRQRAEAVGRALATFGVARSKIAITPKGDTQPLYAELMPSGEAGNRRVEVYLGY